MSEYVTPLGRVRLVTPTSKGVVALLWCDVCESYEPMNAEQFHGELSVDHSATGCPSGYHETHDFAAALPVPATVTREGESDG